MRALACLVLGLLVLFLPACGDDPASDPDPVEPFEAREGPYVVPQSEALAGMAVESTAADGWTLRHGARPERRGDDRDAGSLATGRAGGGGRFRGPGGSIAPGMREPTDEAAPPSGAPVPSPSTPPPPSRGRPVADPAAEPAESVEYEDAPLADADSLADMRKERGRASSPANQSPLKAGSTDDNLDYEAFLTFLATWSDREGVADRYDALDVSDRRYLSVVDGAGRPVPGARVHVVDEKADAVVWSGTTYGDGRVPFYPRVLRRGIDPLPVTDVPEDGWLVEVHRGDRWSRVRWDGEGETLAVPLEVTDRVTEPLRLDVCFLIDTTGSMRDEIDRIKATLLQVTERLRALGREFDLHYGAVLYRDITDEYITKAHPFTADVASFATALQAVRATGGGDGPESLNQGLAEAVGRMAWRDNAAKVLFLVADAPPHMDYEGDIPYGTSLLGAVDRGIRVHAVAASGIDAFGTLVFRQTAQFTRGKFIFIEYGSAASSAASHGVTGSVKSNNLDDILFEQIQAELDGWGKQE